MEKQCPQCRKTKPEVEFSKHHRSLDGLQVYCKVCTAERFHNYRRDHLEATRASWLRWRKKHPITPSERERKEAWSKVYRREHPEVVREAMKKQYKKRVKAGKIKPYKDRIEEQKAANTKWRKANRDKGFCHICGRAVFHENWHLDHIIPLSRGGEHSYRNVAVSHPVCNIRKAAS